MKEQAKKIREELKKIGITSKQVSVTSDYSSVDCKIKDFTIDPELVSNIAKKYERIRYCEFSHEILSGGNSFVFVSYDWQAESALMKSEKAISLQRKIEEEFLKLREQQGIEILKDFKLWKLSNNSYAFSKKNESLRQANLQSVTFEAMVYAIQNNLVY